MRSSGLPRSQQTFFAFLLFFAVAHVAVAQDRLVLRDNRVLEGKVTGMQGDKVMLQQGPAALGWAVNTISKAEVAEPPELAAARQAMRSGDSAKALRALQPIVERYKGLPTPWAEEATSSLGDVYLAANDLPKAEAAYADFRRLYPGGRGSVRADVGLAALDVSRKNNAGARKRLEPIAEQALKTRAVTAQDGAIYGQVFLLLGQVQEADGQYPEALRSYLRTVTLFYNDPVAVEDAQKRADSLRQTSHVIAP